MKVLFIDTTHSLLPDLLSQSGLECDFHYHWTREQIENSIHQYDGVVIRSRIKIDKSLIDKGSKLKFIARVGAGMENIDVSYAESKRIQCLHAPEGNRDAVAEHALGMLLCLFNNICKANLEVREGKWIREGNRGIELAGKTVGIIGYGNMGSAFAQRLNGFDVNVLVYDKYKKNYGDDFIKESSLNDLFQQCDIVSFHVPLTAETHEMINADFIGKFQKNIFIINTARGKILKTSDLVKQLQSGKVAGACLDVLEYEDLSFEKLSATPDEFYTFLLNSPRVVLTPHVAGWTHESNEKMARVLAEKIIRLSQ